MTWTTFFLEIINFFILIWILKRFFYRPILEVIARRRTAVEKTLADAQAMQAAAEALKTQYENRLGQWDKERQTARDVLDKEMAAEGARRLAALQADLQQERDRAQALAARDMEAAQLRAERTALAHATQFATRLLSAVAGPDVERRLLDFLLQELPGLSPEAKDRLRAGARNGKGIHIVSAFPLDESRRRVLGQSLATFLEGAPAVTYEEDKDLLAGVRITMGDWALRANLRDELKAFAESSDGG
ncbi:MAG: F0F1 ATP synthase subunit delta [Gammaproteobacteria bacterium]|nr:F0F1 ATP synthase subunit delta [Gammaproteobacteria bacterium]